jgi:hypothetical protein
MNKFLRYIFWVLNKIGLTRYKFIAIVVPITLSILFFIFIVITSVFYLIETNIGSTDHAGYWINNKTSIYHKNYTLYCYDLTIICHSEFFLLFKIINFNDAQMHYSNNIIFTSISTDGSKTCKINFNSKCSGFYWTVDVIVIVSSDGCFCVLDKKTKIPIAQLHKVCKENSLIKIDNNAMPVEWIFESNFTKNTDMFIGTEYDFLNTPYTENNLRKLSEQSSRYNVLISVNPQNNKNENK